MRITFLTHFPGRGGSTVLLQQLADFFSSRGHSIEIICGQDDSDPLLKTYRVVPQFVTRAKRRAAYLRLIDETSPDRIYVISGTEEFDLLRFVNIPRIHHISSLEQHDYVDIPFLIQRSALFTDLFTGNTSDVLHVIQTIAAPTPVKCCLAPYRIDPIWLTDIPFQSGESPLEKRIRVCFSARLESYQKRAHWLGEIIPACERLGLPLEWHILGDGPCKETLRSALNAQMAGPSPSVFLHGWKTGEAMRKIYLESDLFFLCSRWEGLPIAMVEALLSGIACVVPDGEGGVRELLSDGSAGWLYAADSPRSAAEALRIAVEDRRILNEKKRNARSIALARFSADVVERALLELEQLMLRLSFNGHRLDPKTQNRLHAVRLRTALKRRARDFFRKAPGNRH